MSLQVWKDVLTKEEYEEAARLVESGCCDPTVSNEEFIRRYWENREKEKEKEKEKE